MTEPGNVKPLESFKELGGTETLVDGLLQQMMQVLINGELDKKSGVCNLISQGVARSLRGEILVCWHFFIIWLLK